jgi:hypothetical protein
MCHVRLAGLILVTYICLSGCCCVFPTPAPKTEPEGVVTKDDQPAERPQPPRKPAEQWIALRPGGSVSQGDISVRIDSLSVGKVGLATLGEPAESQDDLLRIRLTISNKSDARKIDYTPWHTDGYRFYDYKATLEDELGNNYRRIGFTVTTKVIGQQVNQATIYKDQPLKEVLVFEKPVAKARFLKLTLPGENLALPASFRLRIPAPATR